jgi:hypothetical protein
MPKNKVNEPITDQEMAFARLVLSGTMTDREAAEVAGLKPGSAAYIKSKPTVRAYMLQHRAAVQQQLVQQEADGQHRLNLDRKQVLDRLWEIANLNPEMTRGSITGQVKALSIIVAMENLIADRRALPSEKNSAPAPTSEIHTDAWLRRHQAKAHATTNDPLPAPDPNHSTVENRLTPSEAKASYVPLFNSVPDLGVDFPTQKPPLNPFVRPR